MSCKRCSQMRVVQLWVQTQSGLHKVYSYVQRPDDTHEYDYSVSAMFCECLARAANGCACPNSVATTGAGCPANGAAKCASCNTGFTLTHDKTQCIGECTVRTCVRIHCSPKLLYARICVVILQQMSAYAIMALRQLAPIAPSMALQSVCRTVRHCVVQH